MTTSDIEAHIRDIYGVDVSDTTVSRITDKILPVAKEWQQRPLESVYAVVFMDAIHYHVRSEGQIVKKAVYIAIGIDLDGRKDVLGIWVCENESAKFWATVLNGLRNRGVEDIFIACTDNLTGFSAVIEAVFPKTEIQNCIIHQLRNSSKYVSYKDIKALMADLKAVYAAVDESAALDALDAFAERWDKEYPKISPSWRENWANLSTYFKYRQETRRCIMRIRAGGCCRSWTGCSTPATRRGLPRCTTSARTWRGCCGASRWAGRTASTTRRIRPRAQISSDEKTAPAVW